MDDKITMTKKFNLVGMGDVQISTSERPIVGTDCLATCIGILLYCEEDKKAIVAHATSDIMPVLDRIFKLVVNNKLYRKPLKYKIIWGTDREPAEYYGVDEILKKHFDSYIPFDDEFVKRGVMTNENTFSNEFAFDASTGEFVTDKVFFGSDYYLVNGVENNIQKNKQK